ncbi:MAG: PilN domain-containing protein [Acidobacteria bacterium]|nr:PilN domain-containing protein [Acidobacteriota bacterium]MCI0722449.1 PilN domain-containing protein [Acidobacteriota bacterium]
MIKINLLGRTKLKAAKAKKISTASNQTLMAVMAVAVVLMSVGIIYFWERILSQQDEELSQQIMLAKKEKVRQEGMLKENEVFEKRRKLLETRINVIESLKKNQSGPVQVLDLLSDCVQRSDGVWLKDLTQKDNLVTVNGTAMGSPDAVADFITNLTRVGNFKNVNLVNLQELDSKYSFSITFEGNIVASSASAS